MYSIFDFDRYGYYVSSDNKKFYNKLECILHCKTHNINFAWHFNDQYYDVVDWITEPVESITELYAQRARELREKYDYLVLHLSGGWDSGNILETFMTNDIRLDEVITRGPYGDTNPDPRDRSAANTFAEIELCAVPIAKIAKETYQPDLKITVIETKQPVADLWKQNKNWFELGYNDLDPGQLFRGAPHLIEPRYLRMLDQGKTVAHIYGVDKPRFHVKNHDLHLIFDDVTVNRFNPFRSHANDICFIEHFYWAPSTGRLLCKQAHMILKQLNLMTQPMDMASQLMFRSEERDIQTWIGKIIYPDRFLPIWDAEKASHAVFREWHQWFFNDYQSEFFSTWKKHMDHLNAVVPKKWFKKPNVYDAGYKIIPTQGRQIGTIRRV